MGTRARVVGCGLAVLAVFGAIFAVVLGAWVIFAVKRASAVWPEGQAAPTLPDPGLPADPEAWDHLQAVIAVVPEGVDTSTLGEALAVAGPPRAVGVRWEDAEDCIAAMDRVVEGGGIVPPVLALDHAQPEFVKLLVAARLRLLRAWRYAEQDRDAEALAELLRVERFGLLLEHAGGNLILTMVGVAVQDAALDEILDLLAARPGVPSQALVGLQAELEAGLALPQALPGAIAGECLGAEATYEDMRHWDRQALFEATRPGAGMRGGLVRNDGCCPPFYDPDATIQLHRWRCARLVAAAEEPGGAWPVFEPLFSHGALDPGQYLDNPIGRILLDISAPSFASFQDKITRLHRRRLLVAVRVALRRFTLQQPDGALPTTLGELVPTFLAAVPEGVSFDPAARTLSVVAGPEVLSVGL
ncbi:MAG: hypothetical protein ABIO70_26810 [Pseudomonadota bacterium]